MSRLQDGVSIALILTGLGIAAYTLIRAGLASDPPAPTHAYIQGQLNTLEDCRTAGKTKIAGEEWSCTGGSIE